MEQTYEILINPAWRPITDQDSLGFLILGIAGAILIGLTVFTYLGNPACTGKRLIVLLLLRLTALAIAILTTIRPSLAVTEIPKVPSTLIIAIDRSESMSVKDEFNDYPRWDVVVKTFKKCEPILEQLKAEQEVTVHLYQFAKEFKPDQDTLDLTGVPDGARTDFGTLLKQLYDKHQGDRNLRGILIVSDGRDNGTAFNPLAEALKWKGIACPIFTFGVGQSGTRSNQKDIAFTSVSADPSPVPIKADLSVTAKVNAQGFEGAKIEAQLFINDHPSGIPQSFELPKATGNEIVFTTKAPEKPGEYKLSVRLTRGPVGDVFEDNNSIDTYLTVTKEGVRVLVIDKLREEIAYLRGALATDKRFDYVEVIRQTDVLLQPEDAAQFDLQNQAYDVVILGDISPRALTSINPNFMTQLAEAVTKRRMGLIMIGGVNSFGGTLGVADSDGWNNTPIAEILPVKNLTRSDQISEPIKLVLTQEGESEYLTKLDSSKEKNRALWERLNDPKTQLNGFTLIGEPKTGAKKFLYALKKGDTNPTPLLVGQDVGEGRTLAFGADTTGRRWLRLGMSNAQNPREGLELHARFWKQMILWAAHQDEVEGNVFVRPEFRRMAVSGRQSFQMGVRDKRGEEINSGDLRYQVLAPNEQPDRDKAIKPDRDSQGKSRASFEPKIPGEYRVYVWGEGKDETGNEIKGEAQSRFIVYPEMSEEMLQIAANPKFLLDLENAANNTAMETPRRVDSLPSFLEQLRANPLKPLSIKPKLYPDWSRDRKPDEKNPNPRRSSMPWFLPTLLILFVAVLGVEWGLRRAWGMV
jgi:uncharacterized membrane protein